MAIVVAVAVAVGVVVVVGVGVAVDMSTMSTRTKVRTITAARIYGYNARFLSELKTRGHLDDPGWGYVYLEEVEGYRASHPVTPPYARPDFIRTPETC